LRILEGNRSHRPIPDEPHASSGPCDPPPHLSDGARDVWLALAPELEAKTLLAPRYLIAFETFCNAVVSYRLSQRLLDAAGPLVNGRDGGIVTNPAAREVARFFVLVRQAGSDFGMSPAAVSAIAKGTTSTVPHDSPARLLG
jgi:P27 family predicted phage terminase small subunit